MICCLHHFQFNLEKHNKNVEHQNVNNYSLDINLVTFKFHFYFFVVFGFSVVDLNFPLTIFDIFSRKKYVIYQLFK